MPHVAGTKEFRVSFTCIMLTLANGKKMRALVIAQAPVPGNPRYMYCGLVLENGVIVHKVVPTIDLNEANRRADVVTMVEAPDLAAPHALFAPDGSTIKVVKNA